MKLHATIGENEVNVEIRREGARVFANVDGREYELDARRSSSGVMLRTAEGKIFDCRVDGQPSSGEPVDVFVGAYRYPVTLTDPKRLRAASAAGGNADGAARIVAPMPGKVVRVLVNEGDAVEAGQGLLVVEAMKMQNEICSPKSGKVERLLAKEGQAVNAGEGLAWVE